ncbi:MAG: pilus assembly protein PilM [Polaromonas sp.]|nr:pilus assembly protein PilM [Polaromonas sp.]
MKSFFQPKPEPLIGLDIGAASLCWVELAPAGRGGLRLERCATEALEPGCIVDGHIERFDEVATALQRLTLAAGSRHRRVALAMPIAQLQTRQHVFPLGLSQAELARQVSAEVVRHSGRPVQEATFDYGALPQATGSGPDAGQTVWIATAPIDKLQDRLGLAESIGLLPVIMDGEAQARARAARRLVQLRHAKDAGGMAANAVVVLVHVEAGQAVWQWMDGDTVLHQGQLATQDLHGVDALARTLLDDMWRADETPALGRPELIMLAGAEAMTPGLAEAMKSAAACECLLADPLQAMQLGDAATRTGLPPQPRASLMTACGLALRRVRPSC